MRSWHIVGHDCELYNSKCWKLWWHYTLYTVHGCVMLVLLCVYLFAGMWMVSILTADVHKGDALLWSRWFQIFRWFHTWNFSSCCAPYNHEMLWMACICACFVTEWSWAMEKGYGACLLQKPQRLVDMIAQAKSRVSGQQDFTVSMKIRLHDDIK